MTDDLTKLAEAWVEAAEYFTQLARENPGLLDEDQLALAYLDAQERRDAARAAFTAAAAKVGEREAELRSALRWAISEIDRNTCQHDETHRGGAIWTICDLCDKKWADDEGGFKPYVENPRLTKARRALAPQGAER